MTKFDKIMGRTVIFIFFTYSDFYQGSYWDCYQDISSFVPLENLLNWWRNLDHVKCSDSSLFVVYFRSAGIWLTGRYLTLKLGALEREYNYSIFSARVYGAANVERVGEGGAGGGVGVESKVNLFIAKKTICCLWQTLLLFMADVCWLWSCVSLGSDYKSVANKFQNFKRVWFI